MATNFSEMSTEELLALRDSLTSGLGGLQNQETSGDILEKIRRQQLAETNAVVRGIGRGVDLTQMGYGSALEGLGRVSGIGGLEKYGAGVVAQQEEDLAETAPFTTRLKDVREAEGVLDTTGKLAAFGGTALGESLPQMGTTLAGSALGAARGAKMGSIFGLPGAATGAILGGMAANIPFFYGMNREAQKEAVAEGKKIELNEGAAFLASFPQAFLDTFGDRLTVGLKTLGLDVGALTRRGSLLTRGVKGAAAGITAEVPTELGQQVIERYQAGRDLLNDEAMAEYAEVMAAAGLVGGSIRATGDILRGDISRRPVEGGLEGGPDVTPVEGGLEGGPDAQAPTAADIVTSLQSEVNDRDAVVQTAQQNLDALNAEQTADSSIESRINREEKIKTATDDLKKAQKNKIDTEEKLLDAQAIAEDPEYANYNSEEKIRIKKELRIKRNYEKAGETIGSLLAAIGVNAEIKKPFAELESVKLEDVSDEVAIKLIEAIDKGVANIENPKADFRVLRAQEMDKLKASPFYQTLKEKSETQGELDLTDEGVKTDVNAESVLKRYTDLSPEQKEIMAAESQLDEAGILENIKNQPAKFNDLINDVLLRTGEKVRTGAKVGVKEGKVLKRYNKLNKKQKARLAEYTEVELKNIESEIKKDPILFDESITEILRERLGLPDEGRPTIERQKSLEDRANKLIGNFPDLLTMSDAEFENINPNDLYIQNKEVLGVVKRRRKEQKVGTGAKEKTATYEGKYNKDGKYHGQGTYTTTTGDKYVGEFKDGKIHGQGTSTFTNGDKYVGEHKDGVRHGRGTSTYASGTVEEGLWENGELVSESTKPKILHGQIKRKIAPFVDRILDAQDPDTPGTYQDFISNLTLEEKQLSANFATEINELLDQKKEDADAEKASEEKVRKSSQDHKDAIAKAREDADKWEVADKAKEAEKKGPVFNLDVEAEIIKPKFVNKVAENHWNNNKDKYPDINEDSFIDPDLIARTDGKFDPQNIKQEGLKALNAAVKERDQDAKSLTEVLASLKKKVEKSPDTQRTAEFMVLADLETELIDLANGYNENVAKKFKAGDITSDELVQHNKKLFEAVNSLGLTLEGAYSKGRRITNKSTPNRILGKLSALINKASQSAEIFRSEDIDIASLADEAAIEILTEKKNKYKQYVELAEQYESANKQGKAAIQQALITQRKILGLKFPRGTSTISQMGEEVAKLLKQTEQQLDDLRKPVVSSAQLPIEGYELLTPEEIITDPLFDQYNVTMGLYTKLLAIITNNDAKTSVDEALNKNEKIIDAQNKTAASIDLAELDVSETEFGIEKEIEVTEQELIDAGIDTPKVSVARLKLKSKQLKANLKRQLFDKFNPELNVIANTESGKRTEEQQELLDEAESIYKEVMAELEISFLTDATNINYSIAPETVTTSTNPEIMLDILSARMGQDVSNAVTIARNPAELGLTELEPTAKGVVYNQKIYLFTDNIEAGSELGVFLHEVGAHVGMKAFTGENNYNRIVRSIKRFAEKTDGSFESRIAKLAMGRVELAKGIVGEEKFVSADDELLAYFIEEAVDAGVDPESLADKTPVNNIFRIFVNKIKKLFRTLTGLKYDNPTAQEVVNFAYGGAKLAVRNPANVLSKIDKHLLYSIPTDGANSYVERIFNIKPAGDKNYWEAMRDLGPGEALINIFKDIPGVSEARRFTFGFTGLLQLADHVSKMKFKGADELAGYIRNIEAIVNRRKQVIDDRRREVEDFAIEMDKVVNDAANKPYMEQFENVIHDSTIDEIDLRNSNDPDVTNKALYKEFKQLPPALQKLYIDLANKYDQFANEFVTAIESQINSTGQPTELQITELSFLRKRIRPYFPLLRHNGNYWLDHYISNVKGDSKVEGVEGDVILDDNGEPAKLRIVESFETSVQQAAALKELKKQMNEKGSNITGIDPPYTHPSDADIYQKQADGASIDRIMNTLLKDNIGLDDDQKRKVVENYIDLFPSSALKKQFKKRKGLAGYRKDSVRNFSQVGHQMATQLAMLEQSKELRDAFGTLDAFQESFSDSTTGDDAGTVKISKEVDDVIQSLKERSKFLSNPQPNSLAATASFMSYTWYILGNLSSAFVNLSQIAIGYFHMAGRYGIVDTHKAYSKAMKMYFNGGRDNNTRYKIPKGLSFLSGFKTTLADQTFGANPNLDPEYKELYEAGLARGAIRRTTGQELIDMQQGVGKGKLGISRKWHKYNYALSWYFQNTERANREIALIAAYDLSKSKGAAELKAGTSEYAVKKGDRSKKGALNFAVDFVDSINGPAVAETGPKHFQDGWGKVIGTFKRFAFSQVYLQYRLIRDATSHLDPAERKIATKQIAMIMIPAYTMAGMKGLPLYGAAETLASMLMSDPLLGEEDEPWNFNTMVNSAMGDNFFYGPMNLLGIGDVASRTGFGNMLFPYDNPYKRERLGWMYYPTAFAGPSVGIADSVWRAAEDLSEGNVLRAVERATPSFVRNPLKAFRYQTEGVVNKNGVPIMEDVPLYSVAMQALGFAPAELTKRYRKNEQAKQYERKVLDRRSGLLTRLNGARYAGDFKEERKIRKEIVEFNRSNFGKFLPINTDSELRSFKGFMDRAYSALHGVNYNKSLQDPILEAVGME